VETDVVILHTIQDFVRWAARKALLPFKPDGFDQISRSFRDSNGGWIAVSTHPIFYGYNSERVPAMAVPKLAIDFLRPQFKGKLVSAYPADDDASLFAFKKVRYLVVLTIVRCRLAQLIFDRHKRIRLDATYSMPILLL
jgi:ABC-type Fe3+ transport system substrate-binding protein